MHRDFDTLIRPAALVASRLALAMATWCCATSIASASSLEHTTGRARDARTGRLLYEEQHWIRIAGSERSRLVVYRCPDGRAFARKRVFDTSVTGAPAFEFDDARDGYREGVEGQSRTRRAYWRASASAPLRERKVDVGADTVIDAGFDAWVRDRWAMLASGSTAHARFVVPSRGAPLPIRVKRVDAPSTELVRFRLSLDSWLDFVAPDMQVTYDAATRRLRSFEGLGTIRARDGSPIRVHIDFAPPARGGHVSEVAYEKALTEPLENRCE